VPSLAADAYGAGVRPILWTVYLGLGPTALGFATWSFALGGRLQAASHRSTT